MPWGRIRINRSSTHTQIRIHFVQLADEHGWSAVDGLEIMSDKLDLGLVIREVSGVLVAGEAFTRRQTGC